jgi:hypothetical protein
MSALHREGEFQRLIIRVLKDDIHGRAVGEFTVLLAQLLYLGVKPIAWRATLFSKVVPRDGTSVAEFLSGRPLVPASIEWLSGESLFQSLVIGEHEGHRFGVSSTRFRGKFSCSAVNLDVWAIPRHHRNLLALNALASVQSHFHVSVLLKKP